MADTNVTVATRRSPIQRQQHNVQELNMTESGDKQQHDEDSQDVADAAENERINDPLTQTDVKAPRVPFGSRPSSEES
jgi:cell division protein FtsL